MSVSYGGDSITFADGSVTSSGWTGYKNRLINADMRINQRAGTANTTMAAATDVYTLDRWLIGNGAGISANVAISTDAPAGFNNSVKISIVTTSTSSNTMYFMQKIEGYNTADLNWGTSSAATCTLSFWVKSSVQGTYNAYFFNVNADRSYIAPFTINLADTWEYKTITVTGDITGTWNKDNTHGIQVAFTLNGTANAYASGTINQWFAGTKFIYTGGTNLATNAGATFQITGVQFEKGSIASSFEYRPFGTEFNLCQRYYSKSYNHDVVPGTATTVGLEVCGWQGPSGAGGAYGNVKFPVKMRTTPTTISIWDGAGTATTTASYTYGAGGSGQSIANGGAWWGSGTPFNTSHSGFFMRPTSTQANALTYCHYAASAEL